MQTEFELPPHINTDFTIGVISMLREQVNLITDLLREEFPDGSLAAFGIDPDAREGVGTPEAFQGNERDIIVFSLCLDADSKGFGHIQNPQRLNVATSRAKQFTYFIYSEIPGGFNKIKDYFAYMSSSKSLQDDLKPSFESDFERYVYSYLECYIKRNEQFYIDDNLVEPTKEKIRTILRIAGKYKHDSLVLGAFGCGAFANPPNHMAELFKEVFLEEEFISKFELIIFSIFEDHNSNKEHNPNGNVLPFLEIFNAL